MIDTFTSVLSLPSVYRLFVRMVGRQGPRNRFVAEYVRPVAGEKVLDLGCGPADILTSLPGVAYTGLDLSRDYIHAAKARYGDRGRFLCGDVGLATLEEERGSFHLVLAKGVVHHLDDERAARLFDLAHQALRPDGRLLTLDGCYATGQSRIARWLLRLDRGQFVRTQQEYLHLGSASFPKINCFLRHDLLRMPYTHLIMRCTKSLSGSGESET